MKAAVRIPDPVVTVAEAIVGIPDLVATIAEVLESGKAAEIPSSIKAAVGIPDPEVTSNGNSL